MQVNNHTQLLNYLIEKYSLDSYCEIGVQDTRNNFDKIKVAQKRGCDPSLKSDQRISGTTSDEYFIIYSFLKYDLIFIDGLHHADQVERDFNNSLKCLNDNGFIVIHDCLPEKEETTHVPRDSKIWHGDVYKFVMNLGRYEGIDYVTLNCDNGCCVVWKDGGLIGLTDKVDTSWESYKHYGDIFMKVIEPSELDKYISKRERVTI
jgi:hypothetical protein